MPDNEVERHYKGEGGERYHNTKRSIPERTYLWVARLRAKKFSPHIKEDAVVFEYGVGAGWNLAALDCEKRIGFDISELVEATLRSHQIEFVSDSKTTPSSSVDVTICHHTLEHALQPPEILREIHRLLKPGGKLLLYVPFEKEAKYTTFQRDEPNHHLYSWNAQTLGNLVEELKFRVEEVQIGEFGYDRFAAVWANKLGLNETGFRVIRKLVHWMKPGREVRIIASK